MLSRSRRLISSDRVELVKNRGRLVENQFLAVRYLPQEKDEGSTKIAFVVSKRIDKRAVRRHQIKRRLRGAVGEMGRRLKPGFDVVVIAKAKIVGIDHEQLLEVLNENLRQAGLIAGAKQLPERLTGK
jgi:ribonuclease P protein component